MVEFIEKGHKYINSKGLIIPSVSELIKFHFGCQYKDVPQYILDNKANYGKQVHSAIEEYENNIYTLKDLDYMDIDPNIKSAVKRYSKLKEKYLFEVVDMEKQVDWQERYAGTYDILTKTNEILDIKTTVKLHKDWLALQTGLYYMAAGIQKEISHCIWVPKNDKGGYEEITPWSWKECEELVERYEKEHNSKNADLCCMWDK